MVALLACVALLGVGLYRAGAIQFNRPLPATYPITGIDVSHHQGAIDWQLVATSSTHFAFVKATEGRDYTDPRFESNWRGAKAASIPRGAYHFFTFCSPGLAQAEHFLSVVPPSADALPPVADVEFVGNCRSWSSLPDVAVELGVFLEAVERAWKLKPILYVTPDSLERVVGERFRAHPIWIRSVFSEPDHRAYRGWYLWQFSDNSRVPGISGAVDRNALRPGLSLQQLRVPILTE